MDNRLPFALALLLRIISHKQGLRNWMKPLIWFAKISLKKEPGSFEEADLIQKQRHFLQSCNNYAHVEQEITDKQIEDLKTYWFSSQTVSI